MDLVYVNLRDSEVDFEELLESAQQRVLREGRRSGERTDENGSVEDWERVAEHICGGEADCGEGGPT